MTFREKLESLPESEWINSKVMIKPIVNEKELIYATYDCQLTKEQQNLVNPSWFEIGRSYLDSDDNYPCIIYNEELAQIGFINLKKWLPAKSDCSWSYYIDKNHQGKGYGQAAEPDMMIKLATEAGNKKAQALYSSLGFKQLPEMDGDDLVFGL